MFGFQLGCLDSALRDQFTGDNCDTGVPIISDLSPLPTALPATHIVLFNAFLRQHLSQEVGLWFAPWFCFGVSQGLFCKLVIYIVEGNGEFS